MSNSLHSCLSFTCLVRILVVFNREQLIALKEDWDFLPISFTRRQDNDT